jgi:hemoglobin
MTTTTITPAVSLYEEIGGQAALRAAVDVCYQRILADPELARLFPSGVSDRHRAFVVSALGEALSGPVRYRGPLLTDAHRDLGITDAQFDRAAAHLSGALDELGVPRPLAGQVIVIVAKLRWAIVTA